MKKLSYLILGLIFIIAFLMRWKLFAFGDFLFFQDQSRDLLLVKEIMEKGHIILIGARTGFGGLFHGPLWIYSLVPTYLLSGGNPYFSLVPVFMAVAMGTVVAGYVVGSKLYDKWTGILFALFLSLSLPLNESVYFMTNAHAMPLALLIYIYFFIKYIRGSEKSLIAIALMIGIGIHLEAAFAFSLIPMTGLAILYKRKLTFKTLALSLFIFLVSISNYIIFELRHNFLMTNSLLRLGNGGGEPLKGYENYQNLWFRVLDRFQGFLDTFSAVFYSQDLFSKILIFGVFALGLIILVRLKKEKKENKEIVEYAFLISFPALSFLFYILYPFPLWSHYILSLSIPVIFLFALFLRVISKRQWGTGVVLLVCVFATLPVLASIPEYYLASSHESTSDSSYKNQLDVASWILKDSGNKPFNYLVFNPSTFTYGMDYLFSWKTLVGDRDIHSCSKQGLTYLIYYPTLKGDTEGHKFWKENVVNTKTAPLVSKSFRGNIRVEKINIQNDKEPIDPNYCQNLSFR